MSLDLCDYIKDTPFSAGRIKYHLHEWKKITSDYTILEFVQGCKILFQTMPKQHKVPKPCNFNKTELLAVNNEIAKLLHKQVIVESEHEKDQYISNIFLRPKKNNTFRMILNLKKLNTCVEYKHFKMDTLQSCTNLVTKYCFMASIDLTDAYYSVPIDSKFQKYLKFEHEGTLYQFTCLPNGLSSAPRYFTKLLKPVLATLRNQGYISSAYLDDIFLVGETFEICRENLKATLDLLNKLGFFINIKKSVLDPTQIIEHLGFVINSKEMTVSLNGEKIEKIQRLCKDIISDKCYKVKTVAQVIGTLISSLPAVSHGQLFYRQIEIEKILALKKNCGNFNAYMTLSQSAKEQMSWWITECHIDRNPIIRPAPDIILQTDSSLKGWGAKRVGGGSTGGRWNYMESLEHINYLELKAAYFGIMALCKTVTNKHILIQMDNTTAVAYVRNMGGTHSLLCNKLARELWKWCKTRNIWLSATHISGVSNVVADKESRSFDDRTEWKLDPLVFQELVDRWGKPDIDLFASRLNFQIKPYVSWRADPEALAVDAFTLSWTNKFLYCFPPFSLIGKVIQKLEQDGAQAILITPVWTTQTWFPKLKNLMIHQPVKLPRNKKLLTLPSDQEQVHPLYPKLRMQACLLSTKNLKPTKYQREPRK